MYTAKVYSTHAVVVITYKRPRPLAACLRKLLDQSRRIDEIVVVDQSPDEQSRDVCRGMEVVRWVDNRANAGNMTSSRNVGLWLCKSDIVSFIDDDSLPTCQWAEEVMAALNRHPDAGGIAGRTTERGEGLPLQALPSDASRREVASTETLMHAHRRMFRWTTHWAPTCPLCGRRSWLWAA